MLKHDMHNFHSLTSVAHPNDSSIVITMYLCTYSECYVQCTYHYKARSFTLGKKDNIM